LIKCQAKIRKVSTIDLKAESKAEVSDASASILPLMGVFGLTSSTLIAMSFLLLKNKNA
jgi:hypothetical protein